jgi:hypothetical protein
MGVDIKKKLIHSPSNMCHCCSPVTAYFERFLFYLQTSLYLHNGVPGLYEFLFTCISVIPLNITKKKIIREKGGKEIEVRKGERKGIDSEELRYERNRSPLNFNGFFTLLIKCFVQNMYVCVGPILYFHTFHIPRG